MRRAGSRRAPGRRAGRRGAAWWSAGQGRSARPPRRPPPQQAGDLVFHPFRGDHYFLAERGGPKALWRARTAGHRGRARTVQSPGDGGVVDPERPRRCGERSAPCSASTTRSRSQSAQLPARLCVSAQPLRNLAHRCAEVHSHFQVMTHREGRTLGAPSHCGALRCRPHPIPVPTKARGRHAHEDHTSSERDAGYELARKRFLIDPMLGRRRHSPGLRAPPTVTCPIPCGPACPDQRDRRCRCGHRDPYSPGSLG